MVRVYQNYLDTLSKSKWPSIASIIQVDRVVTKKEGTTKETAYFISDLAPQTPAAYFARAIREHWRIESFHYIKDITFLEDDWRVRTKNAPVNYSLIRNFSQNVFRSHGFDCIQAAMEKCANNVPYMLKLIE